MADDWRIVVRLGFKGNRFKDHALDLSALAELQQFQRIVAETAKALWRAAHLDRRNLPPYFEERTKLCLRRIDDGSAVAPLEVYIGDAGQTELFGEEPPELREALDVAHRVFEAADIGETLPENLPKALVPEYAKFGSTLSEEESIEVSRPGRNRARVTSASRSHLERFVESTYESTSKFTGYVLEADVRQRRFQLWTDDSTSVVVDFSEDQEECVTSALRDHRSVRVRVGGRGTFDPLGKPRRVTDVRSIKLLGGEETPFDPTAKPIEQVLEEIAAEIPDEEWQKLPTDLSANLDHYIYGTPKQ